MAAGLQARRTRCGSNGRPATYARTFDDVGPGELMLYEDAYRTLALAINRGSARSSWTSGSTTRSCIEP